MGKWSLHASLFLGNKDMFFEMRFDLGTLDSGELSLPFGLLVIYRVHARIFFFFRHHFRQFDFFGVSFFKFGPFIASHINLMMKVISCNLSTWGCFIDF